MSCNCFCAAAHPERGICDSDAPPALLVLDLAGSAAAELGDTAAEDAIAVCLPCGEAAMATHPRARNLVCAD